MAEKCYYWMSKSNFNYFKLLNRKLQTLVKQQLIFRGVKIQSLCKFVSDKNRLITFLITNNEQKTGNKQASKIPKRTKRIEKQNINKLNSSG